jgi:hypothetical protein
MSKISVDVMKEAAQSAASLLDSASPEIKLVLENPHFSLGLAAVLYKEVQSLKARLTHLEGDAESAEKSSPEKGQSNPAPNAENQKQPALAAQPNPPQGQEQGQKQPSNQQQTQPQLQQPSSQGGQPPRTQEQTPAMAGNQPQEQAPAVPSNQPQQQAALPPQMQEAPMPQPQNEDNANMFAESAAQ